MSSPNITPAVPNPNQLAAVFSQLPAVTQEMAGLLGLERALRVVSAFGGRTLLVPTGGDRRGPGPTQRLIDELGCQETAEALIQHYGGATIYLPRCAAAERAMRNYEIHRFAEERLRDGVSMNRTVAELAASHRLSDRHIWQILKKPMPTIKFH